MSTYWYIDLYTEKLKHFTAGGNCYKRHAATFNIHQKTVMETEHVLHIKFKFIFKAEHRS